MAQDGSGACCGSGLQRMFVATWQVQMQMVQLQYVCWGMPQKNDDHEILGSPEAPDQAMLQLRHGRMGMGSDAIDS